MSYELGEKIGHGGMGVVYRARDQRLGRTVAIKFMHAHLVDEPQTVDRFMREAQSQARLSHPNIAQVYDIGKDNNGCPYIVMELVQGESLMERIRRGPMTEPEALHITRQIVGALSEAHRNNVIHRDVKPDNIRFHSDGSVRLLDFGIAKALDDRQITHAGGNPGSPNYMSPEQCRGQGASPRSDLYSAGIVLFEMLMGRVPFKGETTYDTQKMHVEAPLPPLPDSISGQTQQFIAKSLAKDPNERYESAIAMLAALNEISGTPVPSAGTPVPNAGPTANFGPSSVSRQDVASVPPPIVDDGFATTVEPTPAAADDGFATSVEATPPPTYTPTPTPNPNPTPTPTPTPDTFSSPNQGYSGAGTAPATQKSGGSGGKIALAAILGLVIVGGGGFGVMTMMNGNKGTTPSTTSSTTGTTGSTTSSTTGSTTGSPSTSGTTTGTTTGTNGLPSTTGTTGSTTGTETTGSTTGNPSTGSTTGTTGTNTTGDTSGTTGTTSSTTGSSGSTSSTTGTTGTSETTGTTGTTGSTETTGSTGTTGTTGTNGTTGTTGTNENPQPTRTEIKTVTQPIEAPTKRVADPNLERGRSRVETPGRNGQRKITYEVTFKGETVVNRKKISEEVVVEPRERVVRYGTKPKQDNTKPKTWRCSTCGYGRNEAGNRICTNCGTPR